MSCILKTIEAGDIDSFREKLDSEYSKKKGGKTILQIAIENGQTEMVKLILDFLSEDEQFDMLNEPNFEEPYLEEFPLHTAVRLGHTDIVMILLDAGADLDDVNREFDTPLDVAYSLYEECGSSFLDILHLLLNAIKAEVEKKRNKIELSENEETKSATLDRLEKIGSSLHSTLCKAFVDGNDEIFEIIMSLNVVNLDETYNDDLTLLHLAVIKSNEDIIKLLIDKGVDMNAQCSEYKNTPLHIAATLRSNSPFSTTKSTNFYNLLVEGGAETDIKNEFKLTPEETADIFHTSTRSDLDYDYRDLTDYERKCIHFEYDLNDYTYYSDY